MERRINRQLGAVIGAVAVCGAALLAVQTALVGSDMLTLRFAATVVLTLAAGWVAWRGGRAARDPAPDPIALVLAGAAGLAIFAAAWWGMDLADHLLRQAGGALPLPQLLSRTADRLLGADLLAASYEIAVLANVVLIPWAQSWLLWGTLRRAMAVRFGVARGAWLTALIGGCVLALSAPQQVEPSLPSGLASLPGYLLVSVVAAWAAALSRSYWAGFAAQGTFAYASLALRDDLLRVMVGRGYLDTAWLTALLLGGFGAAVVLQVIRFRAETDAPPSEGQPGARGSGIAWVAMVLVAVSVLALAAIDLARRG